MSDARLSDEALADLLADCERRLDHWRKHGAQVEDDPGVGCVTVAALVREVQRLRSNNAAMRRDTAALSREIRASLVVAENNALRKTNERLLATNKRLTDLLKRAESANTTAQTMAAHWKLKATGEPLDD